MQEMTNEVQLRKRLDSREERAQREREPCLRTCGDHSTEVIAALCHVNLATGSPLRNERKSHIRNEPSSAPDTTR